MRWPGSRALARDEPRIRGIVAFAPLEREGVEAHLDALNDNDWSSASAGCSRTSPPR